MRLVGDVHTDLLNSPVPLDMLEKREAPLTGSYKRDLAIVHSQLPMRRPLQALKKLQNISIHPRDPCDIVKTSPCFAFASQVQSKWGKEPKL